MVQDAFQSFVDTADGNFEESMDYDVQDRQKSQTYVAKKYWQLRLCGRIVWWELLAEFLMECQVLVVPTVMIIMNIDFYGKSNKNLPIILLPVIGRVLPNKFHNAIPKLIRFQQQQLDDVEAYLSLTALLGA